MVGSAIWGELETWVEKDCELLCKISLLCCKLLYLYNSNRSNLNPYVHASEETLTCDCVLYFHFFYMAYIYPTMI